MNEVPPHHPELLTMARALRQSALADHTHVTDHRQAGMEPTPGVC